MSEHSHIAAWAGLPGPSRPGDSVPEGYVFEPHVGIEQGSSDTGLIKSCTGPGGADLWGVAADSHKGRSFYAEVLTWS